MSCRYLDARVSLLLLAFIAIVCFATAVSVGKEFNSHDSGPTTDREWTDEIGLSSVCTSSTAPISTMKIINRPQVFASFAWTVFVLLRPIHQCLHHPGYEVGFDCFIWVYLAICCISGASFSKHLHSEPHGLDLAMAGTIRNLQIVAYFCAFIMVSV